MSSREGFEGERVSDRRAGFGCGQPTESNRRPTGKLSARRRPDELQFYSRPSGRLPLTRSVVAIIAGVTLAGCSHAPPPAPQVSISGPTFARSQFDCGERPLPPDPGKATGKSAAVHENRLGSWGAGCQSKLQSVGSVLEASGQVVKP